jgi:hypothetical protein
MKAGVSYVAIAVLIVLASIVVARIYDDPHIVNRGGALLAAIAASLVLYEAFFEERVKKRLGRESTDKSPDDRRTEGGVWPFSPRAILAQRLALRQWRSREQEFNEVRMGLLLLSGILAVLGEIIHGFGDLLYEHWLAQTSNYLVRWYDVAVEFVRRLTG